MIFKLAWKHLLYRLPSTLLSWVLLTASVATISLLLILQYQFEKQYTRSIKGIDMVIGAKGSPLQLILSAVYHIDDPTGNIPYTAALKWMQHPFVARAIPLAYGDNYRGYSIVGTTMDYLDSYGATIADGRIVKNDFEVVAGSSLADRLHLRVGSRFHSTHGSDEHGEKHTHKAYTIVGIAAPTGTALDNILVSNITSVWEIHDHDDERQLTAVLLKFRNPMGSIQLPRIINEQTNMMAALPAIEINRLFSLFGTGIATLKNIGIIIMLLAALSVFVALFNSLKERRYELALMRTFGASRLRLAWLLLLESLVLCLAGFIAGILLSRTVLLMLSAWMEEQYHLSAGQLLLPFPGEGQLLLITAALGIAAAMLPAVMAWSINISSTLSHD
jgi:putative ABC transport system permease protein